MRRIIFGVIHSHNIMLLTLIGISMLKMWRSYPDNHWGVDIRYGFILCVIDLILCVIGLYVYGTNKWMVIGISIGILAGIFLFITDYFNVLVEYELWLKRGMPDIWRH